MKSLLDWITDLEAEEFPKRLDRRIAREIRADFPTCLVRSTRGDPTSYCHHVERELVKIWNDVPFWEFLQGAPSENAVADYVRKKFGLALPPFARSVWLEMAKDIPNRKRLFDLLKSRPGTLPSLVPENAESDALEDLLDARLVNLFFDYLRAGRLDRKRALALLRFQPESYKILASAAAKLAKDAWWCAYELAKDTPVIPVETLIKKRGAPAKAEPIARLERLVQIAHEMPFATCYEMVRAYKISLGQKCEFKDEKAMRGLRDEAGVAKRLAEVRDGISVKHHIEDGIGRKPRRKNLGATK